MKKYKKIFDEKKELKEGTLLVFEELMELYNETRDMEKFAKGLIEALTFLTADEWNVVIDEFNNVNNFENDDIII